jgi:uncharacterized membrane protein
MTKIHRSRIAVPITVIAAGSVIAGAVAVGHTWQGALITELVTLAIATAYYATTGRDSDAGAIYGQRADERQVMVRMEASRLAFIVMICGAFVCAVVTVALNDNYWQADAIGSLGGLTFLLGLVFMGAHNQRTSGAVNGIMDASNTSKREDRVEDFTNS